MTATAFDTHVEQLRSRLTADVDTALERQYLPAVIAVTRKVGWVYRQKDGVDMLVDAEQPKVRSALHLVFLHEKVRPEYEEGVPASNAAETREGILLAPVRDPMRMKLTSFRLKDRVHIQDMDAVGLTDAEAETAWPDLLRRRLAEVRASG